MQLTTREACLRALLDSREGEREFPHVRALQRLVAKDSRNLEEAYNDFLTHGHTEQWCDWACVKWEMSV